MKPSRRRKSRPKIAKSASKEIDGHYAFELGDGYWEFARTVRTQRRFIFDGRAGAFLSAVRATSTSRERQVRAGIKLFRAQLGSELDPDPSESGMVEHPLSEARMIPDSKYIKNGGRANPPGFPYLYLTTTKETALAEMRPWVGESLTLAIFEVLRDIRLVECRAGSNISSSLLFLSEKKPSPTQLEECAWNDIGNAFVRPVERESQQTDYLPTQILAELFKAEGFDGIAFKSSLERGTNVVLFDPAVAKPIHRFVYTLKRVRYDFEGVYPYLCYNPKDPSQGCEIHTEGLEGTGQKKAGKA